MFKPFRLPLTILILTLLVMLLSGCSVPEEDDFDIATKGIVDVILRDYNDGTVHYDCVGPDKLRKETEEFVSEASEILFAEDGCFESEAEGNQVENHLIHVALTDADGNPAASTPVIDRIFEKAAEIPHEISKLYILRQDDYHFAVAELNINMFSPCKLFYYDHRQDKLTELYSYDATEVIGLRIRNPENIPS